MRHIDMRLPLQAPVYPKGRFIRWSKGRLIGRYGPLARTAGERMTFLACLRLADAEQHGRGLTRVLR